MSSARVVGHRRPRQAGLHWPDGKEADFLDQPFRQVLLRKPSGIVRYKSHEAAQFHMEQLLTEEAMLHPLVNPAPKVN
jgi:hypothetical protein